MSAPAGDNARDVNARVLTANLAALEQAGCPVRASHLAGADDGDVVLSGSAVIDVGLHTPDGLVRLDPATRPVAEAARTLPAAVGEASLVAVVGAGAGYAIDALLEQRYAGRIVVLEPSLASCLAALSRRDWTSLIATRRLRWLVGSEYDGWLDTWSWVTPGQAPAVVIHPVLGRLRGPDVRRALEIVKKMVFNASANERARLQFGARYLRHTLANLSHLAASRDVGELFGRFAGVPVVVLAAGPSLDRNVEELRPLRGRALVIAVDTALRPCIAAGLAPDLVVGVDPGEVNLRHLAVGAAPEQTHLVAEPSLAPGSFEPFGERVFTFRVGDHDPWPWLVAQGVDRSPLRAWGSVLASALDLAVKVGGDPVILLGADFAYTGGQPYCRNTAYEADWARDQAEGHSLEVIWRQWIKDAIEAIDMTGRLVRTTPHLIAFRDWIANYCRGVSGVTFINGTGAGLLGELQQMPVGDVLAGRGAVDVARLIDARDPEIDRLPDSLMWWDEAIPPQPWTAWTGSTTNTMADLLAAGGSTMRPDMVIGIAGAAGVLGGVSASTAAEQADAAAAYWSQVNAPSASVQVAAARRVMFGPMERTSEVFYSAICVLLRHADAEVATACLTEALRADFAGSFRMLLPLLAHACQRTGDIRSAQLLFAACQRLGLLSGRNAWASDAARETTLARALQLAARKDHGPGPQAEYRGFVAAVTASAAANGRPALPPDSPLRLPDFIVAGAGGCGGVLLYDWLCTSPSVWARRPKELHFFSNLPELGARFYAQFFEDCPRGLICGEVSASYLAASDRELAHGGRDVAADIAAACPAARVIVIVKDPAARALSLYGPDVAAGAATLADLRSRRGDRPLDTGKYVVPLRRLAVAVGRDRLLVLATTALMDAPTVASRLSSFLDIVAPDASLLPTAERDRVIGPQPSGRLYDELREYYAPTLIELEAEFGVSL